MEELGVEIGLAKSLVSPNRLTGEFAKRFFTPRDCSMVPISEALAARFNLSELMAFVTKYRMSVAQALRFSGFGYRVLGKIYKKFSSHGRRAKNLLLSLAHPSSPLGVSTMQT